MLFTGDLVFNGGTPFVMMGSVAGRPRGASTASAPSAPTPSSPATAPSAAPRCSTASRDTCASSLDLAERGRRQPGSRPLDVARDTDLGRFAELTDAERFVGNLHRAYAELRGAERGARIDVRRGIGDMVAYNGGRPLRCLA